MVGQGHGEKLSRKQELAISALLLQPTIESAAEAAGIGQNTLYRWLRDEDFQRQYREVRRLAITQALARLQQVSSTAVDALLEICTDTDATPSARVSAARTILEQATKSLETEDLAERVAALEKLLSDIKEEKVVA